MKPETLVAQALHAIDEATGAIVPPIHLTTTFARGEDYQTLGGMVYARDGHWRESEASFRRAIELNPNSPVTRLNFVMNLLWPLGRIDDLPTSERGEPHVAVKGSPA